MTPLVAVAIAGFAGTPHCLGMCGSLAAMGSQNGGFLPYQAGRISVYIVLGAIAGAFGAAIPGPAWLTTAISGVLLVGFAAALAGFLPEPKIGIPGLAKAGAFLARRHGPAARFGFGIVNGLLPCGLLYATLAVPISTGSALYGALLMGVFGVISALPLTAAAFGMRALLRGRKTRIAMAAVVLLTGMFGLANRGGWFAAEDAAPSCHHVE
ncbi:MAG: sulfite exporter TauE/SafE family protein [Myxococcota bacterium]